MNRGKWLFILSIITVLITITPVFAECFWYNPFTWLECLFPATITGAQAQTCTAGLDAYCNIDENICCVSPYMCSATTGAGTCQSGDGGGDICEDLTCGATECETCTYPCVQDCGVGDCSPVDGILDSWTSCPCSSFTTSGDCISPCIWCTDDSICHESGYTCGAAACSSYYTEGTCASPCIWCTDDSICHESGYTCGAAACSSYYTEGTCASPCIWCTDDSICHESSYTCGAAACSSYITSATCPSPDCMWCTDDSICHESSYVCGAAACSSYYTEGTCVSPCIWCTDDSICHESGYTCGIICDPACGTGYTCVDGVCTTTGYCGDYTCGSGETCTSCPSDCGTCAGAGCTTSADCTNSCSPYCLAGTQVCCNGVCSECCSDADCTSSYPTCDSAGVCTMGGMECQSWVGPGSACNPPTTCCSSGMCTNGYCEAGLPGCSIGSVAPTSGCSCQGMNCYGPDRCCDSGCIYGECYAGVSCGEFVTEPTCPSPDCIWCPDDAPYGCYGSGHVCGGAVTGESCASKGGICCYNQECSGGWWDSAVSDCPGWCCRAGSCQAMTMCTDDACCQSKPCSMCASGYMKKYDTVEGWCKDCVTDADCISGYTCDSWGYCMSSAGWCGDGMCGSGEEGWCWEDCTTECIRDTVITANCKCGWEIRDFGYCCSDGTWVDDSVKCGIACTDDACCKGLYCPDCVSGYMKYYSPSKNMCVACDYDSDCDPGFYCDFNMGMCMMEYGMMCDSTVACGIGDGCCPPGCSSYSGDMNYDKDCGGFICDEYSPCDFYYMDGCCPPHCSPQSDVDCKEGGVYDKCMYLGMITGQTECTSCMSAVWCPDCWENPYCCFGSGHMCAAMVCMDNDYFCPPGCTEQTDNDCMGQTCSNPGSIYEESFCSGCALTWCPDEPSMYKCFPKKHICMGMMDCANIYSCYCGDGCCPPGCDPSVDCDCGGMMMGCENDNAGGSGIDFSCKDEWMGGWMMDPDGYESKYCVTKEDSWCSTCPEMRVCDRCEFKDGASRGCPSGETCIASRKEPNRCEATGCTTCAENCLSKCLTHDGCDSLNAGKSWKDYFWCDDDKDGYKNCQRMPCMMVEIIHECPSDMPYYCDEWGGFCDPGEFCKCEATQCTGASGYCSPPCGSGSYCCDGSRETCDPWEDCKCYDRQCTVLDSCSFGRITSKCFCGWGPQEEGYCCPGKYGSFYSPEGACDACPPEECVRNGCYWCDNTGRCVSSSDKCKGCTSDNDCWGESPFCDTATGKCMGCFDDSDCKAFGWMMCDPFMVSVKEQFCSDGRCVCCDTANPCKKGKCDEWGFCMMEFDPGMCPCGDGENDNCPGTMYGKCCCDVDCKLDAECNMMFGWDMAEGMCEFNKDCKDKQIKAPNGEIMPFCDIDNNPSMSMDYRAMHRPPTCEVCLYNPTTDKSVGCTGEDTCHAAPDMMNYCAAPGEEFCMGYDCNDRICDMNPVGDPCFYEMGFGCSDCFSKMMFKMDMEDCMDGKDNNGNGDIDCADKQCFMAPECMMMATCTTDDDCLHPCGDEFTDPWTGTVEKHIFCKSGKMKCDTATGKCVGCFTDDDCCATTEGKCTEIAPTCMYGFCVPEYDLIGFTEGAECFMSKNCGEPRCASDTTMAFPMCDMITGKCKSDIHNCPPGFKCIEDEMTKFGETFVMVRCESREEKAECQDAGDCLMKGALGCYDYESLRVWTCEENKCKKEGSKNRKLCNEYCFDGKCRTEDEIADRRGCKINGDCKKPYCLNKYTRILSGCDVITALGKGSCYESEEPCEVGEICDYGECIKEAEVKEMRIENMKLATFGRFSEKELISLMCNNDGTCDTEVENVYICPDCLTPANGICELGENNLNSPQDCSSDTCGDGTCDDEQFSCPREFKESWDCCNLDMICDAQESVYSCEDCVESTYCGDDFCGVKEINTCPDDCEDVECGDGVCEGRETSFNCKDDCTKACGNKRCEDGEDSSTCAKDCIGCNNGVCEPGEEAACVTLETPSNDCEHCDGTCGERWGCDICLEDCKDKDICKDVVTMDTVEADMLGMEIVRATGEEFLTKTCTKDAYERVEEEITQEKTSGDMRLDMTVMQEGIVRTTETGEMKKETEVGDGIDIIGNVENMGTESELIGIQIEMDGDYSMPEGGIKFSFVGGEEMTIEMDDITEFNSMYEDNIYFKVEPGEDFAYKMEFNAEGEGEIPFDVHVHHKPLDDIPDATPLNPELTEEDARMFYIPEGKEPTFTEANMVDSVDAVPPDDPWLFI